MIDADRQAFAVELLGLAEMYRRELSRLLVKLYWEGLREYSYDDVLAAIREWIWRQRFFPVVAELRECVEERIEHRRKIEETAARSRRALPMSVEEQARADAAAKVALDEIRPLLGSLTATIRIPLKVARDTPLTIRPSAAEQAAHDERKQRALEQLRTLQAELEDSR